MPYRGAAREGGTPLALIIREHEATGLARAAAYSR